MNVIECGVRMEHRAMLRLMFLSLFVMALVFVGDTATAQSAGWQKSAEEVEKFGGAAMMAIVVLCAAGGVGAIGYAGKLLLKKAGERGDDVEWSKIGYAVLGGVFLLSIAFVADTTVSTLSGKSSTAVDTLLKKNP